MPANAILFTSRNGTQLVTVAGKNGYLLVFDRNLKNALYKVAITTIENVDAPLTKEGTRCLPGTQGGTDWYGPTYSPITIAIYVAAIDWATTVNKVLNPVGDAARSLPQAAPNVIVSHLLNAHLAFGSVRST